jgi:hypothetical protein
MYLATGEVRLDKKKVGVGNGAMFGRNLRALKLACILHMSIDGHDQCKKILSKAMSDHARTLFVKMDEIALPANSPIRHFEFRIFSRRKPKR